MDIILHHLNKIDKFLAQFPKAMEIEKKTHIPKAYIAIAAVGFYLFLVAFNVWGALLVNLLGFIYPTYLSFKQLESTGTCDATQWLTYWIFFGFLNIIEFFGDTLLYWIPFYYVIKTFVLLYLYLPQFNGAKILHEQVLRPYFNQASKVDAASDKKNKAGQVSDKNE